MVKPLRNSSYVAVLLCALGLGTAQPAAAQTSNPSTPPGNGDTAQREQVRALVHQAGERMDHGDRPGAVALLEQARRIRPDATLDYNLGVTYSELSQGPDAATAFERFLKAIDPSRVPPERLADVKRRMAEYERSLSRLRVRVTLPTNSTSSDAMLFLDDRAGLSMPGGVLPASLWLQSGSHRLRTTAPNLHDYQVTIELNPGEQREVSGELISLEAKEELSAGLLREAPRPTPEKRPIYKQWWFWTAVGGGAATLVGVIAAGAAGAFNHTAPGSDLDPVDLAR